MVLDVLGCPCGKPKACVGKHSCVNQHRHLIKNTMLRVYLFRNFTPVVPLAPVTKQFMPVGCFLHFMVQPPREHLKNATIYKIHVFFVFCMLESDE